MGPSSIWRGLGDVYKRQVITLVVFAVFSVFVLKEALTWKHAVGFALIATGAGVIFYRPG